MIRSSIICLCVMGLALLFASLMPGIAHAQCRDIAGNLDLVVGSFGEPPVGAPVSRATEVAGGFITPDYNTRLLRVTVAASSIGETNHYGLMEIWNDDGSGTSPGGTGPLAVIEHDLS